MYMPSGLVCENCKHLKFTIKEILATFTDFVFCLSASIVPPGLCE